MRVAVCQLDSRAGHRAAALDALASHITWTGAYLVVLPELPFSTWLAVDPVSDGSALEWGGLGWVIGPDGDVLATTTRDEPFVTVEVDLEAARAAKWTYPRYVSE